MGKTKYDNRAIIYKMFIRPLVNSIYHVCRKNKIPFFMKFVVGEIDILDKKGEPVGCELATIDEVGLFNQRPAEENAVIEALEKLSAELEKEINHG